MRHIIELEEDEFQFISGASVAMAFFVDGVEEEAATIMVELHAKNPECYCHAVAVRVGRKLEAIHKERSLRRILSTDG